MSYMPIRRPEKPTQFPVPQLTRLDAQVDVLVKVLGARRDFNVNGAGQTVAVLDTGLRTTHKDFSGRVPAQANFTADNGGRKDDASDGDGHGTNVGGIIVANGPHVGVAPGASIVPLKVLRNDGGGSFEAVEQALDWVLANYAKHGISVVSMSLGAPTNDADDEAYAGDGLQARIRSLQDLDIPVIVAAGNDYFKYQQEGMGYPAILRECLSVGAVYDAAEGSFSYGSGATAFSSKPDQITPFSQRLSYKRNPLGCTDIFAPGAPITSSGISNDNGESVQHGTSQATPVVSGVVLLMQEHFRRVTGRLPPVALLRQCLRVGGAVIEDGDDEDDNVVHTERKYRRVDALQALHAVNKQLARSLLLRGPLRQVGASEELGVDKSGLDALAAASMAPPPAFAFDRVLLRDS